MDLSPPRVEFFTIYPDTPPPQRASSDMLGAMPVRASQYCQPMRTANASGFYLYPAVDFALRWEGSRTLGTLLDEHGEPTEWITLEGPVELNAPWSRTMGDRIPPHRAADTDKVLPKEGLSLLDADPREPRQLEMIMGVVARTSPGWGIRVTAPANLRPRPEVQVLEGFLETDWFRSPIPTMVRLTTPGAVVKFFRSEPLSQLHLVPIELMNTKVPFTVTEGDWGSWPDDVWAEYVAVRSGRLHDQGTNGHYQKVARLAAKNNRCPYPVQS